MKIVLGADHGGVDLKNKIKEYLENKGHVCEDVGVFNHDSIDYPDYAQKACKVFLDGNAEKGVLFCGTGIGISIAANKINGIRCANVSDTYSAKKAIEHNDANFLALGGRTVGIEIAYEIVDAFLSSKFEGGRHQKRVDKIMSLQNK